MSLHEFYKPYDNGDGTFQCPGNDGACGRKLKRFTSNSAKNPNRNFISDSKTNQAGEETGGCGFFGFLDTEPQKRPAFNNKRPRADFVNSSMGATNDSVTKDLATLSAQIAMLQTSIGEVNRRLQECENAITQLSEN